MRGGITIIGHQVTQVAFKKCAPFTKCITKIDETTIDDAENLNLVMLMCILIEYSSNYSETTVNKGQIIKKYSCWWSKWNFKKCNNLLPLKYLSNFWRSNCKVELKLKWAKYCVLSATGEDNVNGNVNDNVNGNIIFTIKDTKCVFL